LRYKDIINLFRNYALAGETFKNSTLELVTETKKTRLVSLCETRFIEQQEAVNASVEVFEPIIVSLQNIQESDPAISANACSLLAAVEKSCFVISLLVCENLFSLYHCHIFCKALNMIFHFLLIMLKNYNVAETYKTKFK